MRNYVTSLLKSRRILTFLRAAAAIDWSQQPIFQLAAGNPRVPKVLKSSELSGIEQLKSARSVNVEEASCGCRLQQSTFSRCVSAIRFPFLASGFCEGIGGNFEQPRLWRSVLEHV